MRKVLIGTPCHDGRTEVWYNNSLRLTERAAAANNIETTPVYMAYDSLVQRARNDLVALALEGGFDDLFFIDADMRWEPEWALSIMSHDVDVVGAAYRKKTDDKEIYTVKASQPIPVDMKSGLWIVQGIGTGFLRLSRRALYALWDSSEEYRNEGKTCRWIFDVCPVNGDLMGEDMIACEKLSRLGFPIMLDSSFTPTHIGVKQYVGDFARYVETLNKAAA